MVQSFLSDEEYQRLEAAKAKEGLSTYAAIKRALERWTEEVLRP